MGTTYIPISCSFHDILLDRSTRQLNVAIVFTDDQNTIELNGVIEDVYTKDKVEYLKIKDGPTVRLDHLVSVDNEVLTDYTTC